MHDDPPALLPGSVSATALDLPPGLDFDRWVEVIQTLVVMRRSLGWWLGDALNYGEDRFGESYAQAIHATGYEAQTLANFQWVCRAIPASRRRETLRFSHHAEVAALEAAAQDDVLDRAIDEGWSTRDIRTAAREHSPDPPESGKSGQTATEPAQTGDLAHDCPVCGWSHLPGGGA